MKHKEKVKLARKLRTLDEVRRGVGIFESQGWYQRRASIIRKQAFGGQIPSVRKAVLLKRHPIS